MKKKSEKTNLRPSKLESEMMKKKMALFFYSSLMNNVIEECVCEGTDEKPLSIRIKDYFYEKLQEEAAKIGVSLAQYVRSLLERHFIPSVIQDWSRIISDIKPNSVSSSELHNFDKHRDKILSLFTVNNPQNMIRLLSWYMSETNKITEIIWRLVGFRENLEKMLSDLAEIDAKLNEDYELSVNTSKSVMEEYFKAAKTWERLSEETDKLIREKTEKFFQVWEELKMQHYVDILNTMNRNVPDTK